MHFLTDKISKSLFTLFLLFASCDRSEDEQTASEHIFRQSDEVRISTNIHPNKNLPDYPWDGSGSFVQKRVTKEYFRCKGSLLHPPRTIKNSRGEEIHLTDCGGAEKHSLPLRNDKEFIYPILFDLLNHIQEVTKKSVIITSGHRCPDHNAYVAAPLDVSSKHCIGAEVDFYIYGLENTPEVAVKIIQDYYASKFANKSEFTTFKRYERATNVSKQPWYNKEIMIKIFSRTEGRNYDNRHAFPYLSLQVRFDRERNTPVNFTWEQAQNFLRK